MILTDIMDVLFDISKDSEQGVFASLHEYLDNMYFA